MGYAQLDDSFWCNPKIVDLPALALRLYVRSISFSSALNTGGAVSKGTLRVLDGNAKLAGTLVAASLWDADGDGWQVHDYAQYNISKAKRDAARENARKRWQQPETPVSHDAKTDISHDAKPPPLGTNSHDPKEKVAGTGAGKEQQELASCDAARPPVLPAVARAFQLAESVVGGPLDRLQYELVADWCATSKPEWVSEALDIARQNNKTSLRYVGSIISEWGESGPPERRKPNGNRPGKPVATAEDDDLMERLVRRTNRSLGLEENAGLTTSLEA